jgi:hypothetical protein
MNENNIQPNHFDRSGDFYPLVISYIVSLHGFMELTSRAVIDIAKGIVLKDPSTLSQSEKENELYLSKFINAEKTPLLKDLSLGSNIDTFRVEIDIDEIATELFNNNRYLLENGLGTYAARMLLISAYELKKRLIFSSLLQNDELWQFFRHCRNAAAHNGKFYFKTKEPEFISKWQNLEIKSKMQGEELFTTTDPLKGYLSLGDPIKLLWDVEQKFFKKENAEKSVIS